ncbi:unnamed protein product [Lactuca saligna]|uniref:Activator of Hsp90 ATPase AHSA1-like N-terminal domain-containing protein n=2 Tax=Lactuca TaxID=4235 RepID=A0AA35Z8H4_LACSI|nr:unnamed protein product [Lactuca saligna]
MGEEKLTFIVLHLSLIWSRKNRRSRKRLVVLAFVLILLWPAHHYIYLSSFTDLGFQNSRIFHSLNPLDTPFLALYLLHQHPIAAASDFYNEYLPCLTLQVLCSSATVMAKYGEGDKRWIVEDRPDGANVHNWHWAETNCLEWSRNLLSKLLADQTILDGEGNLFIKTKKIEKVEGEAYVNVRKGKIIPGYELSVSINWQGEARDAEGKSLLIADGVVEIPYIADENADEDPDLRVIVKDEGPIGRRLKDAFLAKGKDFVLKQIRVYVDAMAKGGPAKDELEVKKVTSKQAAAPVSAPPVAAPVKKVEEKKEKKKEGFKTIKLTEKFSCRAKDMFEILMDDNRWKGFTQSNARISKEVGGEISIFDGSVTGTNLELQEGKLIVQKWRFGSWPDGIHSTVRLVLEEPEPGVTVVKLTQTDVPDEDRYGNSTVVENTERGWRDLIFHKIRAVFGFGV